MPSKTQHVYCYQIGQRELFKIGRTRVDPETRMKGWATGSPERPILYRDVDTDNAAGLEKYIQKLLDLDLAENGEFFKVSHGELDHAVDHAIEFMKEHQPLTSEASRLSRTKPNDAVVDPSEEVLGLYRQLREAKREKYLLERRIELLQSKMQVAIGENLGIKGVAKWAWRDHWTMNTVLFRETEAGLYAELFEKYKRDSSSRIFLLDRVDLSGDE